MNKNEVELDTFYQQLCDKYFEDIYQYCKYLVKGQDRLMDFVEESTQQTFLEARLQIKKLKEHPNIGGWLYTTARNLVNKSFRELYKKQNYEVFFSDYIASTLMTYEDPLNQIVEEALDIEAIAAEVINQLTNKEYELYMKYFKQKASVAQLSEEYKISLTATTTRIYRLKQRIKMIARETIKKNTL